MIIRVYWPQCDYPNRTEPIDSFWVEATYEEAEKAIFPFLRPEAIERSKIHAKEGESIASQIGNPLRLYCFLVAQDLSTIAPFHVDYPFHHMWNAYSPFNELPECHINTLEELKTIIKSRYKKPKMNLSRLKWLKVVTPPSDYHYQWAYSRQAIAEIGEKYQIINSLNGLTIFPLGFKNEKASNPDAGDLILLTQHAKITHIVEVLDNKPEEKGSHEKGSWFYRYIKIVWWKPEMDWEDLPHRSSILGFDIWVFDGNPHEFTSLKSFREKWGDSGSSLQAFQEHLLCKKLCG